MRYEELEPEGALRGRARYWRLTGAAADIGFEPVLPDGCVEIVAHLGDPFLIERDGTVEHQARALLAGPGTAPVRLRPSGRVDVVGVRLLPGEAGALLDGAAHAFVDRVPALADVAGELARGLVEELAEPRRGESWTAVLDRRVAPLVRAADVTLVRAVARLRASHGRLTIDELAREAGLSPRALERRFRASVGVGPKMLARIARFRHAWRLAQRGRSLAAVAAHAGYFDQAHLVRDFRQFAGEAPTRFLAAEHALARTFSG